MFADGDAIEDADAKRLAEPEFEAALVLVESAEREADGLADVVPVARVESVEDGVVLELTDNVRAAVIDAGLV